MWFRYFNVRERPCFSHHYNSTWRLNHFTAGGVVEKETLRSPPPDSAGMECDYKSITGCWEQQEQERAAVRGGRRGELPPPPPSSPPGYFTYLQPKRPSTLTAIMTGSSPSLLGTGHLLYFFRGGGVAEWVGVILGEEWENDGKLQPQIVASLLLQ